MVEELQVELDRDTFRKNFLKYTRKAFHQIPKIDNPLILDIGCGSGVQTLELASQSNGKIIAIDIDELVITKLRKRIGERNLTNRINVENCSFRKMKFSEESFDTISAEGVGGFINIETSLKEWKRFIKPKGFLVLHDDARRLSSKLKVISKYNYTMIGHFMLPEDAWWKDYYQPLEKQINLLMKKYQSNPTILEALKKHKGEVDNFKKNPQTSGFVIIQKQ